MRSKSRLEAFAACLSSIEPELTIPLLRTLVAVALRKGLSVSEVAEEIGVPQQTASRYVAILQGRYQTAGAPVIRDSLLANKPSSTDLRRYELTLTPKGNARLNSILTQLFSAE